MVMCQIRCQMPANGLLSEVDCKWIASLFAGILANH